MPAERTALPIAGGVLLLIAGILGIAFWGFVIATIGAATSILPIAIPGLTELLIICGAIGVIFSLIALLGGVFAIQRKMWGLALAGGILGLFSIGWFFISSILALIGLILVAVARKEFA